MKIRRNYLTGGLYTVVEKGGQYYYADLCFTFDHGVEIMIFPSTPEGEVTDWNVVYADWPETVSEDTLIQSVKKFLAE